MNPRPLRFWLTFFLAFAVMAVPAVLWSRGREELAMVEGDKRGPQR